MLCCYYSSDCEREENIKKRKKERKYTEAWTLGSRQKQELTWSWNNGRAFFFFFMDDRYKAYITTRHVACRFYVDAARTQITTPLTADCVDEISLSLFFFPSVRTLTTLSKYATWSRCNPGAPEIVPSWLALAPGPLIQMLLRYSFFPMLLRLLNIINILQADVTIRRHCQTKGLTIFHIFRIFFPTLFWNSKHPKKIPWVEKCFHRS